MYDEAADAACLFASADRLKHISKADWLAGRIVIRKHIPGPVRDSINSASGRPYSRNVVPQIWTHTLLTLARSDAVRCIAENGAVRAQSLSEANARIGDDREAKIGLPAGPFNIASNTRCCGESRSVSVVLAGCGSSWHVPCVFIP